MPFVLDASVTINWALRDEASPLADRAMARLSAQQAIAPSIWWYELRNVLTICERKGRIDAADTSRFLESLEFLPILLHREPEERAVMRLARQHRITVYDAAYLALAQLEGLPLATLDRGMEAAARAEGVELFV